MKKFSFRFAAVLQARAAALDAVTAEMADVRARHAFAVELLTARRQDLHALSACGPTVGARLDPRRELIRQRHLACLRDEIGRRELQLERLEAALEEVREKVAAAHRDKRAIELLEDRDRATWRQEMRRLEQRESDERNAQRFERDRVE